MTSIETSNDYQNYIQLFSVKDPDVIKTKGGLCALRLKLCTSEKDCHTLVIKLTTENNHYTQADPTYYEIGFK